MNLSAWGLGLLIWTAGCALADSGVVIPDGKQSPDPAELNIESLRIQVSIDSGHAAVHWDEVFHNKTGRVLEGTYLLTLPGGAAVSDFAVWDDLTRIPGVILERKRAGELYTRIRNEAIDPGLLESAELSESNAPGEAKHSTQFSVKIVPIPAYGYKRIEAEYRQMIPLSDLMGELILPLKPSAANSRAIRQLSIGIELKSPQTITSFQVPGTAYPMKIGSRSANAITGSFDARAIPLSEDLTVRYTVADEKALRVQAFRDGQTAEPGYFETSGMLHGLESRLSEGARKVIVLFDSSLSMQWEKLERSFEALEATLRSLTPRDLFNVVVFNSEVALASPKLEAATPEAIARTLEFVRTSRLRGATNLRKAFESAFEEAQSNTYIVLLSDGGMTEGILSPARFGDWFDGRWNSIAKDRRPHIYTFAIGDDANTRLLQRLASHAGVFEQVGSTEPLAFKLSSFVKKIGTVPLVSVSLAVSPSVEPRQVYAIENTNFPGTRASWIGEYGKPGEAEFTVAASSASGSSKESVRAQLPAGNVEHPYLPAAWARARVDALLETIDRDGEDARSINEVIQLSRKYHFVTPYTSFLAAPRALLRPRLIRPGDPLLRVRTDSSIHSVIALFPFGSIKALRYLKAEDMWQTRFLAPPDLADGTHSVRLILRDTQGHVFRESKNFVISSHAPVVRVHPETTRIHAGSRLGLRVQASDTTRTITVRLYGADTLFLRWNEAEKSNTGSLVVPTTLAAGRYSLHVTAEDIAHNVSHQEVPLEILP